MYWYSHFVKRVMPINTRSAELVNCGLFLITGGRILVQEEYRRAIEAQIGALAPTDFISLGAGLLVAVGALHLISIVLNGYGWLLRIFMSLISLAIWAYVTASPGVLGSYLLTTGLVMTFTMTWVCFIKLTQWGTDSRGRSSASDIGIRSLIR